MSSMSVSLEVTIIAFVTTACLFRGNSSLET